MSRKVFTAGEVLAAADVNSFLMDQTVMSFAGTAARGSAIGTAVEGMVTFLEDSNILSIYDGANWKTSLGATGGVIQVVNATTSTEVTSTVTAWVSTGLTATITPRSSSNKILVLAQSPFTNGSTGSGLYYTIFRGNVSTGTNLGTHSSDPATPAFGQLYANSSFVRSIQTISHLDSPNTTSAVTYTAAFYPGNSAAAQGQGMRATMTLMEVSA